MTRTSAIMGPNGPALESSEAKVSAVEVAAAVKVMVRLDQRTFVPLQPLG